MVVRKAAIPGRVESGLLLMCLLRVDGRLPKGEGNVPSGAVDAGWRVRMTNAQPMVEAVPDGVAPGG